MGEEVGNLNSHGKHLKCSMNQCLNYDSTGIIHMTKFDLTLYMELSWLWNYSFMASWPKAKKMKNSKELAGIIQNRQRQVPMGE